LGALQPIEKSFFGNREFHRDGIGESKEEIIAR
jgi:hypothetical protein